MTRSMRIVYKEPIKFDEFFNEKTIGFRTKNCEEFKQIVRFIASIIDTVNFAFEPDGIKILSMDSAHISLINCFIPKELFSNYNCGSSNGFISGINLKNFILILNHLKKTDELIMSFEANCDEVELKFISSKYNKFYNMKLLNIEQDNLDITDLGAQSEISIDSKYFNDIINEFSDIGSTIRIKILKDKNKISIKCDGDMTSLKMILYDEEIEYKNLEDLELFFNISNLQIFSKGHGINKKTNIKIGQNVPIELCYNFIDNGFIKYYIAPRLDDDEL